MLLFIAPITLEEACEFVRRYHRHHPPPRGHKFSLSLCDEEAWEVVGVAIIGRPVARSLQNTWTLEVTRLCVRDDIRNGCSKLYGAAWRAARALGYRKLVTYTLPAEGGASLRAAGWTLIGECGGGTWNRADRPRIDRHPTMLKHRWEVEEKVPERLPPAVSKSVLAEMRQRSLIAEEW